MWNYLRISFLVPSSSLKLIYTPSKNVHHCVQKTGEITCMHQQLSQGDSQHPHRASVVASSATIAHHQRLLRYGESGSRRDCCSTYYVVYRRITVEQSPSAVPEIMKYDSFFSLSHAAEPSGPYWEKKGCTA